MRPADEFTQKLAFVLTILTVFWAWRIVYIMNAKLAL
jgi:hypothetical protein